MADFTSFFNDPVMPPPDPAGDSVSVRGGDPNATQEGSNGLQPIWSDAPMSSMPDTETANSVSGLPLQPARWQPTVTPEDPPDITDRNPGTIDKR